MTSGQRRAWLLLPACLVVTALLVVPVGMLTELSLHQSVPGRMILQPGFNLGSYAQALGDSYYLAILGRTVWLSAGVTLVTAILGFPLAYSMWRAPPRFKITLTLLVVHLCS